MITRRGRPRGRWWRRETSRQLLAIGPGVAASFVAGDTLVRVLAAWDAFALTYLLLTWLAYRRLSPSGLRATVVPAPRRLVARLLTSPPEQLPQGAAAIALVATVLAMPRSAELGAPREVVLGVCVVAVFTAWMTLQTGFALAYVARDTLHGGLEFPGDEQPGVVDYAYFAVAVGTSFGTPDVTVTRSRMRKLVLVHGALAFLFNALVVASAVAFVTTQLSAPTT